MLYRHFALYTLSSILAYCSPLYAVCPVVTAPLSAAGSVCNGDLPDLVSWQSLVGIDDAANPSFSGFAWFSDAALTQSINASTFVFAGFDICEAQTVTVYAALLCSEQAQPIAAERSMWTFFRSHPRPFPIPIVRYL
ncbi:MAG: hypothetical protein IPL33_11720 [Sphingobacteriales bacterium]|nr:hypothetical protein [Sphingobacteriales bacterium]